jgi:hypothetical protein
MTCSNRWDLWGCDWPNCRRHDKRINQLKISDLDYARTWVEINTPGIESEQTHSRRVQLFALYKQTQSPASTKPNVADESGAPALAAKP